MSSAVATASRTPAQAHPDSSAAKALALLDAFAGRRALLGVTELAEAVDVPKPTAHRLLGVMIAQGFVRKEGTRYCLTERVFELASRAGAASLRSSGLRARTMPYMAELFVRTRETVHLATLAGTDVLYLEKIFGHYGPRCSTAVGGRKPAYATALGKAMLAHSADDVLAANMDAPFRAFTPTTIRTPARLESAIDRVRDDGFATDYCETQADLNCVAVPIRNPQTGLAIAAISLCSVRATNLEQRFKYLLIDTARDISVSLWPSPARI